VVERVERFQSQLKPHLFLDLDVLHQRQVGKILAWPGEGVSSGVAERAKGSVAE